MNYETVPHDLKTWDHRCLIDYEHISHAGPTLLRHLFLLYQDFFQTDTVPEHLQTIVQR